MKPIRSYVACGALLFMLSSTEVKAFQQTPVRLLNSRALGELPMQSSARAMREEEVTKENRLMDEFRIFDGELINPYKVLGVSRECSKQDVRTAYRSLSRRFHPDVVMHKTILPGSCNNLEDVRNQWERIKLSYEILGDSKTRKRYDRHELLSDPGAAMKRAAFDAAKKGIMGVGRGIFGAGAFAVNAIVQNKDDEKK